MPFIKVDWAKFADGATGAPVTDPILFIRHVLRYVRACLMFTCMWHDYEQPKLKRNLSWVCNNVTLS
jgi:hypothetical protein